MFFSNWDFAVALVSRGGWRIAKIFGRSVSVERLSDHRLFQVRVTDSCVSTRKPTSIPVSGTVFYLRKWGWWGVQDGFSTNFLTLQHCCGQF